MSFDATNLALSRKIAVEESPKRIYLDKYSIDIVTLFQSGGGEAIIEGEDNVTSLKNEVLKNLPRIAIVDFYGNKAYSKIIF